MKFLLFLFSFAAAIPTGINSGKLVTNAEATLLEATGTQTKAILGQKRKMDEVFKDFNFPSKKRRTEVERQFAPAIVRYEDLKSMTKADRDLAIERIDKDFINAFSRGYLGSPGNSDESRKQYFQAIIKEREKDYCLSFRIIQRGKRKKSHSLRIWQNNKVCTFQPTKPFDELATL